MVTELKSKGQERQARGRVNGSGGELHWNEFRGVEEAGGRTAARQRGRCQSLGTAEEGRSVFCRASMPK